MNDDDVTQPPLRWATPGCGAFAGIEWDRVVGHGTPIDPYLVWADLSAGLGFAYSGPEELREWPVILELAKRVELPPSPRDFELGLLVIPGTYLVDKSAGGGQTIRQTRWQTLTAMVQPADLRHVLCSPLVRRLQLGLPRIPATVGTRVLRDRPAGKPDAVVFGFIDDGCPFAHPDLLAADGTPRVIALWDQDGGRKPEPNDKSGPRWKPLGNLGYGAMLDQQALKDAVSGVGTPVRGHPLDPLAPYWRVDYVPTRPDPWRNANSMQDLQRRLPAGLMAHATHGAGVMHLAMGRRPLVEECLPGTVAVPPAREPALTSNAVFVQLPTQTVLDTSGGSLAVHVLDGLQFILDAASDAGAGTVIVNISYGAVAGSHDGTSILESAIRERVDEMNQHLWVVIAAGNAHRARTTARVRLAPSDSRSFVWTVAPDHPHESYLEIWLPEADADGCAMNPDWVNQLLVSVHPPGADPLPRCCVGDVRLLQSTRTANAPGCVGGVVFARRVVQTTTSATMLLVVVAPTRRTAPHEGPAREAGPAGDWIVTLTWRAAAAPGPVVDIRAWTERNDLLHGLRRGQQSSVWGDDPARATTEHMPDAREPVSGSGFPLGRVARQDEAMPPDPAFGTLAGGTPARDDFFTKRPGTSGLGAGEVVVVGGYRLSDGEMAPYSSGGPNRNTPRGLADAARARVRAGLPHGQDPKPPRLQPDADAPSDLNAAVRGLLVQGTLPGHWTRLSGTSAAAPLVARAIANALSETPPPPQPPKPAGVAAKDLAAWRRTDWPTLDDAFRKGRRRIAR